MSKTGGFLTSNKIEVAPSLGGAAAERRQLYTTEGGWLHIDDSVLVQDALASCEKGYAGSKITISHPHV
jgi:hypothetical protein